MSGEAGLYVLLSELTAGKEALQKIIAYYNDFSQRRLSYSRTQDEAIVVAQILSNYYTCVETMFLRIAQTFENSLSREKWHQDLLDKMVLEIHGIRPRVIGATSYQNLLELLKFRHFSRYYYQLQYDWEKLDFLLHKLDQTHPVLLQELSAIQDYIKSLLH